LWNFAKEACGCSIAPDSGPTLRKRCGLSTSPDYHDLSHGFYPWSGSLAISSWKLGARGAGQDDGFTVDRSGLLCGGPSWRSSLFARALCVITKNRLRQKDH